MSFDRLHHMQLAMPKDQESRAREFFVDVLGMAEIDKPPVLAARGGVWFRAGDPFGNRLEFLEPATVGAP